MLRAPVSLTHTHFLQALDTTDGRVLASLVPWVAQRKGFYEAEAVWPPLSILGIRLRLLYLSWGLGGVSHPNPPPLHRAVRVSTCYCLTRELTEDLQRQTLLLHPLRPKDLSPVLSTLCNFICLSVSFSYSLPLSLRSPLCRKAEERLAGMGTAGWRDKGR